MDGRDCVLVVEDEPQVQRLLTEVLHDAGYTVLLANDGHEALRLIDAYQPLQEQIAVVLLDLMLPAVSGRDVLTYLRTHGGAETPVVVISANEPLLSHAADWGANAAVPKPFKLHDLLMTVEACCSVSA